MLLASSPSALDHCFLPFSRVDPEKREVRARFYTSARVRGDKWNLKYETLKRAAKRYMEMPCIREMHQPNAAGKALSLHFDDEKQIGEMVLRVVDDQAWNKVLEQVYRGLSLGGVPLLTRGNDIEDFDWIETSLVDRPKDMGALFIDVRRVEDTLASARTIELPADASDEDLAFARGELEEQLERLEGTLGLARFDDNQPRDDHGMWTIVAGHRVSVEGKAISHQDIDDAKTRFGISEEATAALHKAHDEGKVTTDHHLYRTLSHSEAKAGGLHALTTAHIADGIDHHGSGGSHEDRWHSEAHQQAPKIKSGMTMGHALGAHELQKGDVVHFPSHEGGATVAGVVSKVNPKTIDIGSTVGAAQVGVRVKKDDLKRPGFVRREGTLHHIEVARAEEEPEVTRVEFLDEAMRYNAEAITAVLSRAEPGEREEAIYQVAERLVELARGEGRGGWRTQPRADNGQWTDGAGHLSVDHVHHVMKSEGIHEQEHHDEVKRKIEAGELKTREDVLKHIDALHDARKKAGEKPTEEKKDGDKAPKSDKAPKGEKQPEKTSKPKEKAPPKEAAPHGLLGHVKKFAKDVAHAFIGGVRKGKAAVGRAEGDDQATEARIGSLIEQFYDGVEDADDATIENALQAAVSALGGDVERVLGVGDVPTRENLEGGSSKSALDALRELLGGSHGEFDDKDGLRALLHEALENMGEPVSRGENAPDRGEEVESPATDTVSLARFEEVQEQFQRVEGELSTARTEAQAALSRAEVAEGEAQQSKAQVTRLEGEIEQLRKMPLSNSALRYGNLPLTRTYAANEVLPSPAEDPAKKREQLLARRSEIIATAPTMDALKRSHMAEEIAEIDAQLHRLR